MVRWKPSLESLSPQSGQSTPNNAGANGLDNLLQTQGVQAELGVACDPPGTVICHPAALAGTNAAEVGLACNMKEEGGSAPNARDIALVHVNVVVSLVPSTRTPMTWNAAVRGKVKHASDAVMSPRSNDQNPPGVRGWLLGKPRTCNESQWPP